MDELKHVIQSIHNVRQLINNSILILKDFDTLLDQHGFQPIYGNAIGTESSKSINQSISDYATFFPQYMARQYALRNDMEENTVEKILFINIQFFHGNYNEIPPTLTTSVIVLPEKTKNVKADIENWWLKKVVYEDVTWKNVKKNGEKNDFVEDEGYKTSFWCTELLSINSHKEISDEVGRLVEFFSLEE